MPKAKSKHDKEQTPRSTSAKVADNVRASPATQPTHFQGIYGATDNTKLPDATPTRYRDDGALTPIVETVADDAPSQILPVVAAVTAPNHQQKQRPKNWRALICFQSRLPYSCRHLTGYASAMVAVAGWIHSLAIVFVVPAMHHRDPFGKIDLQLEVTQPLYDGFRAVYVVLVALCFCHCATCLLVLCGVHYGSNVHLIPFLVYSPIVTICLTILLCLNICIYRRVYGEPSLAIAVSSWLGLLVYATLGALAPLPVVGHFNRLANKENGDAAKKPHGAGEASSTVAHDRQ